MKTWNRTNALDFVHRKPARMEVSPATRPGDTSMRAGFKWPCCGRISSAGRTKASLQDGIFSFPVDKQQRTPQQLQAYQQYFLGTT